MSEKSKNEGQLKIRLRNLLNDTWKYYQEGNPPRNDDAYVQTIIEEMKKDFPKKFKLTDWHEGDYDAEVIDIWLKTWLGDVE